MRTPALLIIPLLLTACSQSAPNPPILADIQWSSSSSPQLLTLRPDHTYRMIDPSHPNASPQTGHYDVLSPQYGIIMLDNRTALHLTLTAPTTQPASANPYLFTPITLTPSAAVPPSQRDHFIHIIDQYYAPDSLLIIPNTSPVAPLLP